MKSFITLSTLIVAATLAFSVNAAQEISRQQATEMQLKLLGSVTSDSTLAPMDAKTDLSKKADELGGKYYVVIAADERNHTMATAEVYK